MIKAVIFDMDGTVADTLRSIAGFGNAALAAHGFPALETELYRQLVGNGADVLNRHSRHAENASYGGHQDGHSFEQAGQHDLLHRGRFISRTF